MVFIFMPLSLASPPSQTLSDEDLQELLSGDKTALRIQEKGMFPKPDDLVGVRLNLNIFKSTGKAVQTLHGCGDEAGYRAKEGYKKNKGFYKGQALGYAEAVVLRNAYFNVYQTAREEIATGKKNKYPMASVDGHLQSLMVPEDFEGIEVRFNPKDHHLFVDANNHAIRCAEEVVILGHRAYARGKIEYYTLENAPIKKGVAPSKTEFQSPDSTLTPISSLSVKKRSFS